MSEEKIDLLIEGGNAKPDAAIAQRLGPLKINISQVMQDINEKTKDFKGMKVPVKVIVDTDTKDVSFTIGKPPVSELIKKEINIPKGSGTPNKEKVANIAIEQIIKVAKMKQDSLLSKSLKSSVKMVIGSCNSMGILVEGKTAPEANEEIEKGNFNKQLESESTEVSEDKVKKLSKQLSEVQEELKIELEKEKALEEELKAETKVEEPEEEGESKEGEEGEEKKEGEEAKEGEEKKEEGKEEAKEEKK